MIRFKTLTLFGCLLGSSTIFAASNDVDPEHTVTTTEYKTVVTRKYMAVTANPHATEAATAMLAKGGSAVDATIAAQLVLGLVEPQSSGIGGGAFMVYYDAGKKIVTSFDGRETAPASASADMFLQADGTPQKFFEALVGGRSVGVPGVVAMMELAHQKYGRLPWKSLFDPAIKLAQEGFEVSPRLANLLAEEHYPGLKPFSDTRAYFYPDNQPLQAGQLLKNPAYAETLSILANEGAKAFYHGRLAQQLVAVVRNSPVNPSGMTEQDLAGYRAIERQPACGPYQAYIICGMGPPSSGGLTVLQIMMMAQSYDMSGMATNDLPTLHRFTQLSRLAYADRDLYIADPDFVQVPQQALLNTTYLRDRAKLASGDQDHGKMDPGQLPQQHAWAEGDVGEFPSTSHLSIVDQRGNAVSMTTSIEMGFGSGLMVNGFLLNNQLTDFSFIPSRDGKPVINRIEPGKRPRSSMSPTIVLDQQQRLKLLIGSPGGSRIIDYVTQPMLAVLAGNAPIGIAANLPHITNRNDYTALEQNTPLADQESWFSEHGHTVKVIDLNSGLHAIEVTTEGYLGGVDTRREGLAAGQ
ncbi:gamma-glutamyltransferase [Gynuella sunshinyii]|uniref:Glutathione hydrolase proenzyme n=1 Tax=Gynuella sunshinyii YC6258 TaxID=1445510 RepID=A0A0C5VI60_9GAMM|nr:gamma-glutamyltransferase [Gynuella sunshinyii]AJQ94347.1 gamma-glutamyltransferase [Gynuella sunshinyii YC6258]